MLKPEDRLCLWCVHIDAEAGFVYSELTWNSGTIQCKKDKFQKMYTDNPMEDKTVLFQILNTAKNCDSFELDPELDSYVKANLNPR